MNVIFLHPDKIRQGTSGSKLRPAEILSTLRARGYNVFEITGDIYERKELFEVLTKQIEAGEKFDYAYVESLSRPTNLTIAKLFGKSYYKEELTDYLNIQYWVEQGIPVGFFLRDLHWDFPEVYKDFSKLKKIYLQAVLRKYGRKELLFLKESEVVTFSPSECFAKYLRDNWNIDSTVLRPGTSAAVKDKRSISDSVLKLFYVGGVVGMYDPAVFFGGMNQVPGVDCTCCIRGSEMNERQLWKAHVRVVHGHGEDLVPHYNEAQIGIYPLEPKGYVKLAFSVKIAEYIGHGIPVLAFNGTEVANFIRDQNIGWVCEYDQSSVKETLLKIKSNPQEYQQIQRNVLAIQNQFTWNSLVNRIEKKLLK